MGSISIHKFRNFDVHLDLATLYSMLLFDLIELNKIKTAVSVPFSCPSFNLTN